MRTSDDTNPSLRFYRIPGLELPRVPGRRGLTHGIGALLWFGVIFLATHGMTAPLMFPVGWALNIFFASLLTIHVVRCKASCFTPEREDELRESVAFLAPLVSVLYTALFVISTGFGLPPFWVPFALGLVATVIRWKEVCAGVVHFLCYDNIQYAGTIQHAAGPKWLRTVIVVALGITLPMTGHVSIFLPIFTAAVALLCTFPGDEGALSRWQATYQRMQRCAMKEVRESILLGWLLDGTPLMIPLRTDRGHWEIYAATRGGKSTLLATLIEAAGKVENCSLLVANMKPDKHDLQGACEATGRPVSAITNKRDYRTRTLLLFEQDFWKHLSDAERGGLLLQVLNLDYADVYGESYFREVMEFLATRAHQGTNFRTMKEFAGRLRELLQDDTIPHDIRKNATHLYAIIERLSHSPILNDTSVQTFQLSDLFRSPQILHMHLDSSHGKSIVADLARIALCCLPAAAQMIPAHERCRLIVIVDEIQMIASKNLQVLFQQCASLGILLIITCQSPEDLSSQKHRVDGTITKNASVCVNFSFTTPDELKNAEDMGGTFIDWNRNLVPSTWGYEQGYTEKENPRLTRNGLLSVSAHRNMAMVTLRMEDELNDFGGLPVYIRLGYHISKEEYERRCAKPFPKGEHTILNEGRREDPEANGNGAALPPPPTPPARPVEHINKPKKKRRY